MTLYSDTHILMLEKGEINCEDIDAALCDYADGDLPKTVRARIDAHADSCEFCRENLQSYLMTVKIAGCLSSDSIFKPTDVPSDVKLRLREALNARLKLSLSAEEPETTLN